MNSQENLFLAWPENFQLGLVLGIDESSLCDVNGISVSLQKNSTDAAKQLKQQWSNSIVNVDGTDYNKFRIRCSESTAKDMVLSSFSSDENAQFSLTVKGMKLELLSIDIHS